MSLSTHDPHALLVVSLKADELPSEALEELLRSLTSYIRLNHRPFWEDADDIASEAVMAAYRGIDNFRGECTLFTWLCAIAKNLISKRNKKRIQTQRWDDMPVAEVEAVAIDTWHQQERDACELFRWDFEVALAMLNERQRQVFILTLQDQLPSKIVAQRLGISAVNVRQILVRTCRLIGQKLKEAGWHHLAETRVKDARRAYSTAVVGGAASTGEKPMSIRKVQP